MTQSSPNRRVRLSATVLLVALSPFLWLACDSPTQPGPVVETRVDTVVVTDSLIVVDTVVITDSLTVFDTAIVIDTLRITDTLTVVDTVVVTEIPDSDAPVRIAGPLGWGGGPLIGSSSWLAARLPNGAWGIGTDDPQARLHIRDGELRVDEGRFRLLVTGDPQGDNPAGFGLYMNRDTRAAGGGGDDYFPMGITYQQDGVNLWGTGLDEGVIGEVPDYVSVFDPTVGDVFRFRQGGRAVLGPGIGHPQAEHVLSIEAQNNADLENVLNLEFGQGSPGSRYIRAFENQVVWFAVGRDGRVGVGRDVSESAMLSVNGDVEAREYRQVSDARLKTDVHSLDDGLPQIRALRPVSFEWADGLDGDRTLGFLAQEVGRVFPEAVEMNASGHWTVDYLSLVAVIVKSIQELASEVEELEERVGLASDGPQSEADTVRLIGSLGWGGGMAISGSGALATVPPVDAFGRWGIGTGTPEAALEVADGGLQVDHERLTMRFVGNGGSAHAGGPGLQLDRKPFTRFPGTFEDRVPFGLQYQQDHEAHWVSGLHEDRLQSHPDLVGAHEIGVGDVLRFRAGGTASIGAGVSRPGREHILTVESTDRTAPEVNNLLNLAFIRETGPVERMVRAGENGAVLFAVGADGRMGVGSDASGSAMLSVAGDVEARRYLQLSDASLKRGIEPLDGALPLVRALRPVSFRWKVAGDGEVERGFLAQEVADVTPGLVTADPEGRLTVDYVQIQAVTTRALQELDERVERLRASRSAESASPTR